MKNNIRNIIQITEIHNSDNGHPCVAALCDDSTVWQLVYKEWEPLPQIPQVEIEIESETEVIDNDDF